MSGQDPTSLSSAAPAHPNCQISLVENLRLGVFDAPVSSVFSQIASLATAEDGTLYVLDAYDGLVRTFDADGTFLRRFGGLGSGPGEFTGPSRIAVGGGSVFVFDRQRQAITRFDTLGSYVSIFRLPAPTAAIPFLEADQQSLYFAGLPLDASPAEPVVSRYDHAFALLDRGGAVHSRADSASTYLLASGPIAPDGGGGFWFSPMLEYRLQHYQAGGRLERVITREHDYKFYRPAVQSTGGPLARLGLDVNRAFLMDLAVDAHNYVWVVIQDRDAGGTTIDVFDSQGAWLISDTVRGRARPQRLDGMGAAYATTQARGYPEVVRYNVVLESDGREDGACPPN